MLMVATPQLATLGARVGARLERRSARSMRFTAADEEELSLEPRSRICQITSSSPATARRRGQLVRVLHGSHVPFVITTLSPGGAIEAEAAGLPVLRGDSARQHTLLAAGHRPREDGRRRRRRPGDGASRRRRRAVAGADGAHRRAHAVSDPKRPRLRRRRRRRCRRRRELESVVQLFADVLAHVRDRAGRRSNGMRRPSGTAATRRWRQTDAEETRHMSPKTARTTSTRPARSRLIRQPAEPCAHATGIQGGASERARLRRLPAHRRRLGAPAHLHDVRPRRLLRHLAQQARDEALSRRPRIRSSVARARRALGLVLSDEVML